MKCLVWLHVNQFKVFKSGILKMLFDKYLCATRSAKEMYPNLQIVWGPSRYNQRVGVVNIEAKLLLLLYTVGYFGS